ncbi:acyloxyacyl hydrolase-like, partial [Limulus polyphemus]|uniref:Acyloxyacyl hydrolase-like n=1 Tax=Limulus polyphemus TaxID=6850 RepID=A0ABM1S6H9_LIMPO
FLFLTIPETWLPDGLGINCLLHFVIGCTFGNIEYARIIKKSGKACTVLVGIAEQLAAIHNKPHTLVKVCDYLPGSYFYLCKILFNFWGDSIIEKLSKQQTPDVVCYSLGICRVDDGQNYCHLFPEPKIGMARATEKSRLKTKVQPFFHWSLVQSLSSPCDLPGIRRVCDSLNLFKKNLNPSVDLDKDKHSTIQVLRGSVWRGMDCNDFDDAVYPGRKPLKEDIETDSNCNGIYGIDTDSGYPYETSLCEGTDQRGIIYIGDSVGAHFHIPSEWITPAEITPGIFEHISFILANEFDWPHLSFATGYMDSNWPQARSKVDSLYWRLHTRNRCNHRDYQNLSFNGANSSTILHCIKSISRSRTTDYPAIVFYASMGNDVCLSYMESPADWITKEKFKQNVVRTLEELDEILPKDSHVILVGLVNGSFIYPSMAHRIHPIGQLRGDVAYSDIYKWLNCMQIGPCFGWMNDNSTWRNATTKKAQELTNVLQDLSLTYSAQSFKLYFLENPISKVIKTWEENGGEKWQLLEPVDSLHPAQEAQPLLTNILWEELESRYPEVLGKENLNNAKIEQLFGEQNGH